MAGVSRRPLVFDEGSLIGSGPVNFTGAGVTSAFNAATGHMDVTVGGSSVTFAADSGLPVFNVQSSPYSALGDNSNDDTAEIQAAIDAASAAGGGVVFFPPGIYRISSALSLPSFVTLMGASGGAGGYGNPYIRSTSGTANHVAIANAAYGVTIKNLAFDKSVTATAGAAIYSTSAGRVLLEDCFISRTYDAITLGAGNTTQGDGGNGIWINRCDINQPIHSGITVTGVIELHVTECYLEASASFAQSTGYGIYLGPGCDGNQFAGLDIIGYEIGVYCYGVGGTCTNGYWNRVLTDTCNYGWVFRGAGCSSHYLMGCYAAACTLPSFTVGQYNVWAYGGAADICLQGFRGFRGSVDMQLDDCSQINVVGGRADSDDKGVRFGANTTSVTFVGRDLSGCAGTQWDEGGFTHTGLITRGCRGKSDVG